MKGKSKKIFNIIGFIIIGLLLIGIVVFSTNKDLRKSVFGSNHNFKMISYDDFYKMWEAKESFVLVVGKDNCTFCTRYIPKLKDVSKEYDINIYYIKVNLLTSSNYDNFSNLINYGGSTPTTVFITNGEETSTAMRIYGNVSKEKILSRFKATGFIK